ncbi:MAG: pyridoxamine 5'-phosphate oxidase family protein [Candidatus Omnitrophica bacterium]|nr:pyridoxamine 5'-phosphate oxidase family protein [Candidatus Omnitrophota bacterium]MDD5310338.1 pyridoxamine 5'-phosphate oxidase family protein [Candidatus Omnitrophota bacterium]MDD5545883.1 pyridoxamine 5'-phosphate oxidase family protein [Candidatus Omnitrophota bacterium]
MIAKKINEILKDDDFIAVATCDLEGNPNVAPKLFLKVENDHIYMIDYVIGRTFQNLVVNPKVSLAVTDRDSLTGYQINGPVEILSTGASYDKFVDEFQKKGLSLSSRRIVEGVLRGEGHTNFEAAFPNKVVVFKVKISEVVEIRSSGELKREKL